MICVHSYQSLPIQRQIFLLLWAELYPHSHVEHLVLQNMTEFGNRVFKKVIKWGCLGGP